MPRQINNAAAVAFDRKPKQLTHQDSGSCGFRGIATGILEKRSSGQARKCNSRPSRAAACGRQSYRLRSWIAGVTGDLTAGGSRHFFHHRDDQLAVAVVEARGVPADLGKESHFVLSQMGSGLVAVLALPFVEKLRQRKV